MTDTRSAPEAAETERDVRVTFHPAGASNVKLRPPAVPATVVVVARGSLAPQPATASARTATPTRACL